MSVLPSSPPLLPLFSGGGWVSFLASTRWMYCSFLAPNNCPEKNPSCGSDPPGKADPDVDHCNLAVPVAPVGNLCPRIMYPCILCSILCWDPYFCTMYSSSRRAVLSDIEQAPTLANTKRWSGSLLIRLQGRNEIAGHLASKRNLTSPFSSIKT